MNIRDESAIGQTTLERIVAAWPKRATIRTEMPRIMEAPADVACLTDYPVQLVPFAEHPSFMAAPPDKQRLVNTLAWQAFNARVIAAEEFVANPTFEMLAHGVFPGVDRYEVQEAIQQSHIDEVWHTYMHMIAMRRTRARYELEAEPDYSHPVTNRRLFRLTAAVSERWERDLLFLLWTAVGEISVNAFLDMLAGDRTIQPMHALIARLHSRDEAAHGPILSEVMKDIFVAFTDEQRELFIRMLPDAIVAFGAEDYKLWPEILDFAGIRDSQKIIAECREARKSDLLFTDFSTVQRLIGDLGIEDRVAFDFCANRPVK